MPVRIVQSKQNARLKELRRALAKPAAGGGVVGIEGPNLLEEALRAGLRLECVFVAQGAEKLLEPLHLPAETEVLLLPKALLDGALTTETPQPVAALVRAPEWTWMHLLPHRSAQPHSSAQPHGEHRRALVVVLAGIQDPGNLGTILRSAEAFGANGIVSLPGTVSAWNPKAVRASAGSVFRVPLLAVSAEECFLRLREAEVKLWATAVRGAAPADTVDLVQGTAFLIGNEGNGLPEEMAAQAEGAVTIPCPGPVESLNAAVATSVLLYEAARQRTAAPQREGVR